MHNLNQWASTRLWLQLLVRGYSHSYTLRQCSILSQGCTRTESCSTHIKPMAIEQQTSPLPSSLFTLSILFLYSSSLLLMTTFRTVYSDPVSITLTWSCPQTHQFRPLPSQPAPKILSINTSLTRKVRSDLTWTWLTYLTLYQYLHKNCQLVFYKTGLFSKPITH